VKKYIAVTVGPIFETISLSSKPASLWAASYLFSYLVRTACEQLTADGVCTEEDIVTPYFKSDDALMNADNGVGLFHDHMIFRYENNNLQPVSNALNKAIEKTADAYGLSSAFLKEYINLNACSFAVEDGENIILKCGKMLDCMELAKRFRPKDDSRELARLFDSGSTNDRIKEIAVGALGIDEAKWQMTQNGKLRDLGNIAYSPALKDMKKSNYICVLRSDGDNMSKIIETLKSDDDCRAFSRVCMQYCSHVAAATGSYGGATIYAGGDDLLALVPCENGNGETVFHLIDKINAIFADDFRTYMDTAAVKPALSYGVFIGYKKFPLYEAVNLSADLLFGVSKRNGGKDCITVNLQKHAGQSAQLCIRNSALKDFLKMLEQANTQNAGNAASKGNEQVFLSAGQKISLFGTLFDQCDESNCFNVFENVFDAAFHLNNSTDYFHKTLPEFFINCILNDNIVTLTENPGHAETMAAALRIIKFYTEGGSN